MEQNKKFNRKFLDAMRNNIPIIKLTYLDDDCWSLTSMQKFIMEIDDQLILIPQGCEFNYDNGEIAVIESENCSNCDNKCFVEPIGTTEDVKAFINERENSILRMIPPAGNC